MDEQATKNTDTLHKKSYVEPEIKRGEKLTDVTEGAAPVVSGAVAA